MGRRSETHQFSIRGANDGYRSSPPIILRDVVLAKARTHYPKSQTLCDVGAAIPFITECGGYGSWLSPGRQWWMAQASGVTERVRPDDRENYANLNSAYPFAATSSHRARYAGALPL
ncbi:hypothetical protein SAMN05216337_100977 [Bradyrhizobium brasilense]|uniref:Uncharacterized protein n=1 Tax=Bradyrhizobium brasilense TaxID=1419277 RepID=A0A1G6T8U6_9BRAD|nr:hypothetical protein SAMN05216337_100977 [Bradyrhizobium brasilense]